MPTITGAILTAALLVATFCTSGDSRAEDEMDTGTKVQLGIAVDFLSCSKHIIDDAVLGLPNLKIGDAYFAKAEQYILGMIRHDCWYKLDKNVILLAFNNDDKIATGFVQGLLLSTRSLIYIGFYDRDRKK